MKTDSVISSSSEPGIDLVGVEDLRDLLDERRFREVAGRNVDCDRTRGDARVDPASERRGRFVDRPFTQRDDESGLLGDRDEDLRHHQADLGVRPPGERLETDDRAGADIDLRLKVELQRVAIDRLPQPGFYRVAGLRSYRQVGREQLERVAAAAPSLGTWRCRRA